ncbi:MAG: PD-(D/E)XK nuclease family protein [Verrucomicrobiota bacterium]
MAKTVRQYEEALSQASGERFNVFDILHVGHYEVRTHSPMLAELLNPRGAHGQGAIFLKQFLAHLKIIDFEAESARVVPEVFIGEQGRLDIVIQDGNHRAIFIENKIYAGLQKNQLQRYHKQNSKANLLFLTLGGDSPADWSTNIFYKTPSFITIFQRVSYKHDIVGWLEACRKEAANAPGVRETISQYIHLIKRLTQQNTSGPMNQKFIEAVTHDQSGETYLAYASLRNAYGAIRQAIIEKVNGQLDAIGKELGLETSEVFAGHGEPGENYFYTNAAMKAQNLRFGLRCADSDYRNFGFGFAYINCDLKGPVELPVVTLFKDAFGEQFDSNGFWHAYLRWSYHSSWDDETRADIISGKFATDLDALIRTLQKIAEQAAKTFSVASQQT